MSVQRSTIISHANTLLEIDAFNDYGPNGLQVEGADQIEVIASAVSCTLGVFQQAAAVNADLLLVHHGLFWKSTPQVIDARHRERLRTLFDHHINLAAYHLPLDAHPRLGNNAIIRDELALSANETPFALHGGRAIGCLGTYDVALAWDAFVDRVRQLVSGRAPLLLGALPTTVRTVAICSGGAAGECDAAAALGADVLITGEPRESTHADATEAGIAVIAAGHYATETFGVRALGDELASHFNLTHHFLPDSNPV